VALHGSWNRTQKDGYKVVALHWDASGRIRSADFVTGFLGEDGDVIGRPVDVAEAPNSGTIFVSDDYGGAIYAIRRTGALAAMRRGEPAPSPRPTVPPADPFAGIAEQERNALAATGEAAFAAHGCAACHVAEEAAAGMVTKPLAGLASRYDVASLAVFFATPTPPMPVPPLDEGGRRALAVYVLQRFGS
jgi:mono/diheme cytochrome c family protein